MDIPAGSNVLALDTASPEPAVSVASPKAIFDRRLPSDRQASEMLLAAVARCLEEACLTLQECDRIAVCSGPGSFTGLRVGLSTAWALGRALGRPVETVSTLEAMAEASRSEGVTRVTAALDAGRGEVVLQLFSLEGPRAEPLADSLRLGASDALAAAGGLALITLPGQLLAPRSRPPATLVSRALALAVQREPRASSPAPRAIYSRASAAEEKHGAP